MILTIRTATKPGEPSRNNVIYSEEVIKKAFEDAKENQKKVYLERPRSSGLVNSFLENESLSDFCTVDVKNIIGEVIDNDYKGLIKVKVDDKYVNEVKTLLSSGYKAGIRYTADSKDNNIDKMNIVSYELINIY